jgi:hypothetical protein
MNKRKSIQDQIADQLKWIDDHGGCLVGYVARYGAPGDDRCVGDGGAAIYRADRAALDKLLAQ